MDKEREREREMGNDSRAHVSVRGKKVENDTLAELPLEPVSNLYDFKS